MGLHIDRHEPEGTLFGFACRVDFAFSAAIFVSISPAVQFPPALSVAGTQQSQHGQHSFFPPRKSQRGDSATMKLPMTNRIPGGRETQKIPRQAAVFKCKQAGRVAEFQATSATRPAEIHMPMTAAATIPNVNNHWKIPVPLPRCDALKHSAKYSGMTTPDQTRADALQQAGRPKNQGANIRVRAQ